MNQYFGDIKIHGFRKYHSKFKVDEKNWKIEPDYSGGPNCAELITGAMPYQESRIYATKILKWLQENATVDDSCAVHINISFNKLSEKNIANINVLKLLLNIDENKIYSKFEDRRDNIYSKTVNKIIPFKEIDFSDAPASAINARLNLPDTTYHGVNFTHMNDGRIEWRYLGGKDYQFKAVDILEFMDYFVMLTHDATTTSFSRDDQIKLQNYLENQIHTYKTLSSLDDFLAEYPTVQLQVDKLAAYETVSAYYHKIYDKLFDLVTNVKYLRECIINYDTERNLVEVVNANIETTYQLEYFDFINCEFENSSIYQSDLVNCVIKNSHIQTSKIQRSEVFDSKIVESHLFSNSEAINSFFMGGIMNGYLKGGVLRSGRLSTDSRVSSETKILTDDNFFDIKHGTGMDKKGKKGFITTDKKKILG
jgi:hypothetical protein